MEQTGNIAWLNGIVISELITSFPCTHKLPDLLDQCSSQSHLQSLYFHFTFESCCFFSKTLVWFCDNIGKMYLCNTCTPINCKQTLRLTDKSKKCLFFFFKWSDIRGIFKILNTKLSVLLKKQDCCSFTTEVVQIPFPLTLKISKYSNLKVGFMSVLWQNTPNACSPLTKP